MLTRIIQDGATHVDTLCRLMKMPSINVFWLFENAHVCIIPKRAIIQDGATHVNISEVLSIFAI
ncbi:MAG TPA: hypothetical protein PLG15_04980 [Candidatus Gastranaerophilaceae bacterium]|nr:hypothetical protein [Candidatus Gastranaerophilaceae bacterium]HPT41718.1 hypothetical protein [Candidatus Gastranaerophilaceae bacterium]